MTARRSSGVYEVSRTRVDMRIWCDLHGDADVRGCWGCDVAREWRRTYERAPNAPRENQSTRSFMETDET